MVNSTFELKRTLDATTEPLQIHYYWVSKVADGKVVFLMDELADRRPRIEKIELFLDGYRRITNDVEHVRRLALEELKRDCQTLVDQTIQI